MAKDTVAILCLCALLGSLHAYPLQEESPTDQKNSTYDDTHHIMDLTSRFPQASKSNPTTEIGNAKLSNSSAIPALYVTPLYQRVNRDTTDEDDNNNSHNESSTNPTRGAREVISSEEDSDSESDESSTPLIVEEQVILIGVLSVPENRTDSKHNGTISREVRDTETKQNDSSSKIASNKHQPDNDSGSDSKSSESHEHNHQKRSVEDLKPSKSPFVVSGVKKVNVQRKVRDTEGRISEVPRSYENPQSSTEKNEYAQSNVSHVPGNYANQASSTEGSTPNNANRQRRHTGETLGVHSQQDNHANGDSKQNTATKSQSPSAGVQQSTGKPHDLSRAARQASGFSEEKPVARNPIVLATSSGKPEVSGSSTTISGSIKPEIRVF